MDNFNIKNEDAARLIIDLLITNVAETQSLKELISIQISAAAPSQNRDTILQGLQKDAPIRTRELYEKLRDEIWKQYGHLDLEGF